ncbi:hypothetical protein [Maioricimonas sp. JC845]|uniref:hypothetical protein n=1 Tax=Maioricimonas sp. JC845 TaxID=3232138 RepID=UPI00345A209D
MSRFSEYQKYTFGKCARCNYLATVDVGVDARMNDCFVFDCPKCGKRNTVLVAIRGVEPELFGGRYRTEPVKGMLRDQPGEGQ